MLDRGEACALADLGYAETGVQQKLRCRGDPGLIQLLGERLAEVSLQQALGLADAQMEDRSKLLQRQGPVAVEKSIFHHRHQPRIGHGRHGWVRGLFLPRMRIYAGKCDNDLLKNCFGHLRCAWPGMSFFFDQLPEQRKETAFILTHPEGGFGEQGEEIRPGCGRPAAVEIETVFDDRRTAVRGLGMDHTGTGDVKGIGFYRI